MWAITTSHGYSFGNGLYVGGGVGFAAELSKMPIIQTNDSELDSSTTKNIWSATYLVPLFADVKYSFVNRLASPFVNLKLGGYGDITNTGIRTFVNPSIGVDIDRFSIKVGYEYQLGCWGYDKGKQKHSVKVGLGFTF